MNLKWRLFRTAMFPIMLALMVFFVLGMLAENAMDWIGELDYQLQTPYF